MAPSKPKPKSVIPVVNWQPPKIEPPVVAQENWRPASTPGEAYFEAYRELELQRKKREIANEYGEFVTEEQNQEMERRTRELVESYDGNKAEWDTNRVIETPYNGGCGWYALWALAHHTNLEPKFAPKDGEDGYQWVQRMYALARQENEEKKEADKVALAEDEWMQRLEKFAGTGASLRVMVSKVKDAGKDSEFFWLNLNVLADLAMILERPFISANYQDAETGIPGVVIPKGTITTFGTEGRDKMPLVLLYSGLHFKGLLPPGSKIA